MSIQLLEGQQAARPGAMSADRGLHRRIKAEFDEMPGLKLTLAQAARLFDLDCRKCGEVLEGLVAAGDLATDGSCYYRRNSGRSAI